MTPKLLYRAILKLDRKWWPLLEKHTSLAELRNSVRNTQDQVPITVGLRSACWKAFLLFENLDRSTWPAKLLSSRDAYGALRTHFLRGIEHPDELESFIDPLSDHADVSSPSHISSAREKLSDRC